MSFRGEEPGAQEALEHVLAPSRRHGLEEHVGRLLVNFVVQWSTSAAQLRGG